MGFSSRLCHKCGRSYTPTGPKQKWCTTCRPQASIVAEKVRRSIQLKTDKVAIEKNRAQARKFRKVRAEMGFIYRQFWVHKDDVEALKAVAEDLMKKRIGKE